MSRFGRRADQQRALSAGDRWAQAVREGQARLDAFTQAELDCVTLDPEFDAEERVPQLQAVGPLLSALAAQRSGAAPRAMPSQAALAQAAADLDERGYLRPGRPADSGTPVPLELAAWSVDPAGGAELRPVTIVGDLGIVSRARARPCWVVEVAEPRDPARAGLAPADWQLIARMYATDRPSAGVVEFPPTEFGLERESAHNSLRAFSVGFRVLRSCLSA